MNDTAKLSNLGERSNLPSEGAGRTLDPDDWAGTRLAGGLNANLGGRDHVPIDVERQIVERARRIFDFPAGASGVFVTGTSMANFMAIVTARTAALGVDVRRDGVKHRAAFASPAAYLRRESRGLAAGSPWPCDFGRDLSRGFRALKTWFTLNIVCFRLRDVDAMVDAVLRFGARPFAALATR